MGLDLSAITDTLIDLVKQQWSTAPIWTEVGGSPPGPTFTPNFTGLAPDDAMKQPGPQLSMYLYHVESDNAREALFWKPAIFEPAGGQPTRFLPLALNLFYLLFAFSEGSYVEEQEAMSVALRIYHDNPIVRSEAGVSPPWELTLTMEHRSYDELSRLWQATTAPLRMSLVFRAAVVFIDPDELQLPTPTPTVGALQIDAGVTDLPWPEKQPAILGTLRAGTYVAPPPAGTVPITQSPATAAPGQTLLLEGANLGVANVSDNVYLLPPGQPEITVTPWASVAQSTRAKYVLTLPPTAGANLASVPGSAPPPGEYLLRVGSGALGDPHAIRTESTPVTVAPRVDPTGGPVLSGSAPFTVNGQGFVAGHTQVMVGTIALTGTGGAPAAGQFNLASATSFTFAPPAAPAGEVLPVRVLVNGIEADPALWVQL
jgi:hypothetical protein